MEGLLISEELKALEADVKRLWAEWASPNTERAVVRDRILAIIRRALESRTAEPGWRTMESAPKDGTHILACIGTQERWRFPPTVVHFHPDPKQPGFYTSVNEREPLETYPATHWQPLPAPPNG